MAKTNELAELKAIIAEQKKQIKALEKSAETGENKSAGIVLQLIDAEKKPMNNFVHFDKEQKIYQVKQGRERAHLFSERDANEFLSEPGRDHFIKVK